MILCSYYSLQYEALTCASVIPDLAQRLSYVRLRYDTYVQG
jgi:hypothetical protein|eukprot:COSAG01_NODE_5961_length_3932_cov_9.865901_2_plen_41_part_00